MQKDDVEKGIFKLNFIPISGSYEFRVAEQQTAMIMPAFGFNFNDNVFFFSPTISAYYRYYYNFANRNMKGKRTAKNSVNFVGAVMDFSFWNAWQSNTSEPQQTRFFQMGPIWGIQRNYPKNFSLGIVLGPTLAFGNTGIDFDAHIELSLGFWLGKNQ
jgi:hypothetical protein